MTLSTVSGASGVPAAVEAAPAHERSAAHIEAKKELEEIKDLRRQLKEAELAGAARSPWPFSASFERSNEGADVETLALDSAAAAAQVAPSTSSIAGASAGAAAAGVATSVMHAQTAGVLVEGSDAWTAVAIAAATAAAVATASVGTGLHTSTEVKEAAVAAASSAAAACSAAQAQPSVAAAAAAAAASSGASIGWTRTVLEETPAARFRGAARRQQDSVASTTLSENLPCGRGSRLIGGSSSSRGLLDDVALRAKAFRQAAQRISCGEALQGSPRAASKQTRAAHLGTCTRSRSATARSTTGHAVYGRSVPLNIARLRNISVATSLA